MDVVLKDLKSMANVSRATPSQEQMSKDTKGIKELRMKRSAAFD